MIITIWDIIKSLFKWRYIIIFNSIIAFLCTNLYVSQKQTYTSSVIIQYSDSCISSGKNLKGQDFDYNEIISPIVLEKALNNLDIKKNPDTLQSKLTVTPLIPEQTKSLQNAKTKLGEDYSYYPNTFEITYKGDSDFEKTRDILDSIVNSYFDYYAQNYLYLANVNKLDEHLNEKDYDYLEQTEMINNNVADTIDLLNTYKKESKGYRSTTNGLTFSDLISEYQNLKDYQIIGVLSDILNNKVSKNKDMLLCTYKNRKETYLLDKKYQQEKANLVNQEMDAYAEGTNAVAATTKSEDDNSSRTGNGSVIIDDTDNELKTNITTTYDNMSEDYVTYAIKANDLNCEAIYCDYIINIFSDKSIKPSAKETENVKNEISDILIKTNKLYNETAQLLTDYNKYIPMQHLKCLTGVKYTTDINIKLYELITTMTMFLFSCIIAIAYEIVCKYSLYFSK